MFVLVSYDISDDKRRNKAAKALKAFGDRVQFSVFEMNVNHEEFQKMVRKLRPHINEKQDSARIYRICENCKRAVDIIGLGTVSEDPDLIVV